MPFNAVHFNDSAAFAGSRARRLTSDGRKLFSAGDAVEQEVGREGVDQALLQLKV
jgi:hypothetical protein